MKARACLVRHRYYPGDIRMENQIQALLSAGFAVDVLVMRGEGEPARSRDGDLQVYRVPAIKRVRGSKLRYALEYLTWQTTTLLWLAWHQLRKRYKVVHIQTLPDFLVFAALVPKLLGAKILLDLRECTPELYAVDYGVAMEGRFMKALVATEQAAIRFADHAITCTEQMRQAFVRRGADPGRVSVMLNVADPDVFRDAVLPDPRAQPERIEVVTHGTIKARYGHETLIRAMALVVEQKPNTHLTIYGRGNLLPDLQALVAELGIDDYVTFAGFVPDDALLAGLRRAHIGTVPLLRNADTDLIHTFKMYEYMALGIPVIASRTDAVAGSFSPEEVAFFE
ncbi:MAG: glycosyltransferase family 4 protein, partial [Chloroflexi bacterium]|nr:glycosyltransferase family 4 protein [Chloroflexota bacterium]